MGEDRVWLAASGLLAASEQALADAARPVPGRAFVATGSVTQDCEQLAVLFSRAYPGSIVEDPRSQKQPLGMLARSSEFLVILDRCAPTLDERGNPPAPAAIEEASHQALIDGWVLMTGLVAAFVAGDVVSACDDWIVSQFTVEGPDGGLARIVLRVVVQL